MKSNTDYFLTILEAASILRYKPDDNLQKLAV